MEENKNVNSEETTVAEEKKEFFLIRGAKATWNWAKSHKKGIGIGALVLVGGIIAFAGLSNKDDDKKENDEICDKLYDALRQYEDEKSDSESEAEEESEADNSVIETVEF